MEGVWVAPAHESKQRYWYSSYAVVNVGVVYVDVVPPVPSDTSDHVDPLVIDTCHWNVISPASLSDVVAATPKDDVPGSPSGEDLDEVNPVSEDDPDEEGTQEETEQDWFTDDDPMEREQYGDDPAHLDVPSYDLNETESVTEKALAEALESMIDDDAKEWVYLNMPNPDLKKIIVPFNEIQDYFGTNIDTFSYPFGQINKYSADTVKEIYNFGVTTVRSRFNTIKHKAHYIPRVHMSNDLTNFKIFLKLKTIYEDIKYNEKQLYM